MSESPRDTLAPGVVGRISAPRRGRIWPLVTGAALAGLAVGGRFAGGIFGPEQPPRQTAPAAASQAARESAPPKPAALVRAVPAPSAAPAPTVVPPAAPEAQGSFFVQVASFEVKENAEAVARQLTRQGFSAHSEAYGGPEAGWWHVVRIGPFQNRAEAEAQRLKLPLKDSTASFVLPRPNGIYHLQVASLKSAAKAEQLAGRLRRRGHHVRVTAVGRRGRDAWHCVRIGPFDSREEAEGYRILFEAREGVGARVIPFAPEPPAQES
jgi:cell division septation protein DedD